MGKGTLSICPRSSADTDAIGPENLQSNSKSKSSYQIEGNTMSQMLQRNRTNDDPKKRKEESKSDPNRTPVMFTTESNRQQ
jgi:hypothetical protein